MFVVGIATASYAQGGNAKGSQALSANEMRDIGELISLKRSWTPIQRKVEPALLFAGTMRRGQWITPHVKKLETGITVAADGSVVVDIDVVVTPQVLNGILVLGGTVVNNFPQYNAIRARLPLDTLEMAATMPDIRHIRREAPVRKSVGSVTTEGDITHGANLARSSYGLSGNGIKIGVISDGVNGLSTSQASGDLGTVTILPGQAGSGSEGRAMLEIVHDLAPNSGLYFSTANGGPAQFAANIISLWNSGCKVIVDDIAYLNESPFQDGVVSQAVESVVASGALYFTAAATTAAPRSSRASMRAPGKGTTPPRRRPRGARLCTPGRARTNVTNAIANSFSANWVTFLPPTTA